MIGKFQHFRRVVEDINIVTHAIIQPAAILTGILYLSSDQTLCSFWSNYVQMADI